MCDRLQCQKLFSYEHYFIAKVSTLSCEYNHTAAVWKGNRVSVSSLSFLLKFTLMRIDLPALKVTELPPRPCHEQPQRDSPPGNPPQPSAAHSEHMEASTGTEKLTEPTDAPDPRSGRGYKIQSWHDVAWRHRGSTGKSLVWGQYNQWGAAAPQGRWTGRRSRDLTLTTVPPHLGTAAKTDAPPRDHRPPWKQQVVDQNPPRAGDRHIHSSGLSSNGALRATSWGGVSGGPRWGSLGQLSTIRALEWLHMAGVSVSSTQKEAENKNIQIPVFKYILNCRTKTKGFSKFFLCLWALQTHHSL